MTKMTAVSLFAGVGGFDLALERNGVEVVASAEIDKHARSVLARHFPNAVQYDDVRKVTADGLRTAGFIPERGIITGGFPCQDLSVAGKRAGLVGARSGLFYEIARIADETKAKWLILENVPGLLTSQRGADMGAVVGTLVELGYGVAWRVLDAQHFGVPQRRRRVFIVAERAGNPARAAQVLFERTSVRGDTSQGRAQGQDLAGSTGQGAASATLYEPHHNDARSSTGIANTLVSRMGTGGGQVPLTIEPIPIQGSMIGRSDNAGPGGRGYGDGGGAMFTLNTTDRHAVVEPANGGGLMNCLPAELYHHQSLTNQDVNSGHLILSTVRPALPDTPRAQLP